MLVGVLEVPVGLLLEREREPSSVVAIDVRRAEQIDDAIGQFSQTGCRGRRGSIAVVVNAAAEPAVEAIDGEIEEGELGK